MISIGATSTRRMLRLLGLWEHVIRTGIACHVTLRGRRVCKYLVRDQLYSLFQLQYRHPLPPARPGAILRAWLARSRHPGESTKLEKR